MEELAKNISVILSLKDRFTQPVKQATKSTRGMEQRVKQSTKSIERFGKQANNSFKSIVKSSLKTITALSGIGGALSIAGLKSYASESIDLAKAQIEAETKLEAVLQNVKSIQSKGPEYYKQAAEELKGVASGIQNVGVIGDEVTLAGMQQLATFQLSNEEISTLSKGMTDLLAQQKGLNASQQDAVTIGNMIGKAMQGQMGALSRVGITFTDAQSKAMELADSEHRAAILADILAQNVGGVNAALAGTDQGKIQQMQNAYGDMREEIGKKLLPTQARMANWFFTKIPRIQDAVLGLIDNFTARAEALVAYLKGIYPKIQPTLLNIKDGGAYAFKAIGMAAKLAIEHLDILAPVLAGVVVGFTAFNTITKAKGLVLGFTATIKGATTAMQVFKAVVEDNPVAAIAIAIGALVAVFLIAYNRSETFRNAVNNLWSKIKELAAGLKDNLAPTIQSVVGYIKSDVMPVIDNIKTLLKLLWNNVLAPIGQYLGGEFLASWQETFPKIKTIAGGALHFIIALIKLAVDTLKGLTDFLIGVFTLDWSKAWEGIKEIATAIWDAITGVITGAIDKICGGLGKVKDKLLEILGLNGKTVGIKSVVKQKQSVFGHATGSSYFAGGLTRVNEGGRGEIINLPSGSQIVPHDVSKQAMGSPITISVPVTIAGNVIGNEQYANYLGGVVVQKVLAALNNS